MPGRNWAGEFVAIAKAVQALPLKHIMIDGEAVAHCPEGLPHFHRLLGEGQASAPSREAARRYATPSTSKVTEARRCSATPCAMGLEGIVSKKLTSRYKSGLVRN